MNCNERLPETNVVPIRKAQGGYVAEGPGFYIWDEDPGKVSRAARAIGRGRYEVGPTTRLLIVRDDFTPLPAA